jgi:hypothetical protein
VIYNNARRQGKTLILEYELKFKLIQTVKYNVPEKPFVLWMGDEEIIWLPTGEVISRPVKLAGTKVSSFIQDDWFYNLWRDSNVPSHSKS